MKHGKGIDVARTLLCAALRSEVLGDLERAISQAEEALTRFAHLKDIHFRALCHCSLARLLIRGGSFAEAVKTVRRAMDLYTDMGDAFDIFERHPLLVDILEEAQPG